MMPSRMIRLKINARSALMPEPLVINEHEGHDEHDADNGCRYAFANGIGAQRGAHGAGLNVVEMAGSAPVRRSLESSITSFWVNVPSITP